MVRLLSLRMRRPRAAWPSLPLTQIMLPSCAPERRTARPMRTSPTTVTLMRILSRRVVSPPTNTHSNLREARRKPPRNSSSQRPVCETGSARLKRKQRGIPPIAATSLRARARHFHPTESAGCFSRRKCVPSRNQSQVRISSRPARGRNSAASSPMPSLTPRKARKLPPSALSIL
jgi:hypothetical protein